MRSAKGARARGWPALRRDPKNEQMAASVVQLCELAPRRSHEQNSGTNYRNHENERKILSTGDDHGGLDPECHDKLWTGV